MEGQDPDGQLHIGVSMIPPETINPDPGIDRNKQSLSIHDLEALHIQAKQREEKQGQDARYNILMKLVVIEGSPRVLSLNIVQQSMARPWRDNYHGISQLLSQRLQISLEQLPLIRWGQWITKVELTPQQSDEAHQGDAGSFATFLNLQLIRLQKQSLESPKGKSKMIQQGGTSKDSVQLQVQSLISETEARQCNNIGTQTPMEEQENFSNSRQGNTVDLRNSQEAGEVEFGDQQDVNMAYYVLCVGNMP